MKETTRGESEAEDTSAALSFRPYVFRSKRNWSARGKGENAKQKALECAPEFRRWFILKVCLFDAARSD
jgi:hypothetical protein